MPKHHQSKNANLPDQSSWNQFAIRLVRCSYVRVGPRSRWGKHWTQPSHSRKWSVDTSLTGQPPLMQQNGGWPTRLGSYQVSWFVKDKVIASLLCSWPQHWEFSPILLSVGPLVTPPTTFKRPTPTKCWEDREAKSSSTCRLALG